MIPTSEKQKSKHHRPPDMRLAKTFHFTGNDLAANRSGYLSWRQRGGWLGVAPHILNQMLRRLLWGDDAKGKNPPGSVRDVCGRAKLEHYVVDRVGPRSTLFYEYFLLRLPDHDLTFPISAKQHKLLGDNVAYRIYYDANDKHIYSLERVTDCDEE